MSLCIAYLASVRMAECAEGWARKFKRQTFEEALQKLGRDALGEAEFPLGK